MRHFFRVSPAKAGAQIFIGALFLSGCASNLDEYDEYGYPLLEEFCEYGPGIETPCRPATERDHLSQYGDHPERFSGLESVQIGALQIEMPEGSRHVRDCIGVFDQAMWESINSEDEASECLWVRLSLAEQVLVDIGDQIQQSGFSPEGGRVQNAQNINPVTRWNRGCEQAGIVGVPGDRLLNRPEEPHVHIVVVHNSLSCD